MVGTGRRRDATWHAGLLHKSPQIRRGSNGSPCHEQRLSGPRALKGERALKKDEGLSDKRSAVTIADDSGLGRRQLV
jgi:hypothetical protein